MITITFITLLVLHCSVSSTNHQNFYNIIFIPDTDYYVKVFLEDGILLDYKVQIDEITSTGEERQTSKLIADGEPGVTTGTTSISKSWSFSGTAFMDISGFVSDIDTAGTNSVTYTSVPKPTTPEIWEWSGALDINIVGRNRDFAPICGTASNKDMVFE